MHDFREYPSLDRDKLLRRLAEVHTELAGLSDELAMVLADERRSKAQTYVSSAEGTVSGREREADYNALDLSCSLHEIKGQIGALKEEKELLTLLVTDA